MPNKSKNVHDNFKENGFTWPTHLLHEGRLIRRSYVEPNFICFTLPLSQMNKKIYVSKSQIHNFNNGFVSKKQTKAQINKNKSVTKNCYTVDRSIMQKSDQAPVNLTPVNQKSKNNKLLNMQYYRQQKL